MNFLLFVYFSISRLIRLEQKSDTRNGNPKRYTFVSFFIRLKCLQKRIIILPQNRFSICEIIFAIICIIFYFGKWLCSGWDFCYFNLDFHVKWDYILLAYKTCFCYFIIFSYFDYQIILNLLLCNKFIVFICALYCNIWMSLFTIYGSLLLVNDWFVNNDV